jgi:SAM-dependent methyltransferase
MSNLAAEWNERHSKGGAWAKSGPSQELQRILKEGWIMPCRVLELGCGMGTDAVFLATQGFDVTAVDASPLALEQARAKAATAGVSVRLLEADVLDLPDLGAPFPFIYDRACYQHLRRSNRFRFQEVLARVTQPGSFYLSLVPSANDVPPAAIGVHAYELCLELLPLLELVQLREFRMEGGIVEGKERRPLAWSVLWRRKERGRGGEPALRSSLDAARTDRPPPLSEEGGPKEYSFAVGQYAPGKMRRIRTESGELEHFCYPLVDPRWARGAEASHMRPDDPVLGLESGTNSWALPWWIMKNHHLANLILDGRPILVALCERCSSAGAFDPVINGVHHTFRLEGVYNGTNLAIDHESESLWAATTGEAVHGPMKGTAMRRLPLVQCTWQEWLETHPNTLVPDGKGESREGHGARWSPGCSKDGTMQQGMMKTLLHRDDRLPPNTLVLGVGGGIIRNWRCYPLAALARCGRVLNDTLGGQDIALFCKPGSLMAIAFLRTLDGQCLTFKTEGHAIVDENTGSQWQMSGRAVSGSLKGKQLQYVYSGVEEFFIWAAFHPTTEIYGHEGAGEANRAAPKEPRLARLAEGET